MWMWMFQKVLEHTKNTVPISAAFCIRLRENSVTLIPSTWDAPLPHLLEKVLILNECHFLSVVAIYDRSDSANSSHLFHCLVLSPGKQWYFLCKYKIVLTPLFHIVLQRNIWGSCLFLNFFFETFSCGNHVQNYGSEPILFSPVHRTLLRKNSWFKRVSKDQGESEKESYEVGFLVFSLACDVEWTWPWPLCLAGDLGNYLHKVRFYHVNKNDNFQNYIPFFGLHWSFSLSKIFPSVYWRVLNSHRKEPNVQRTTRM